VPLADWYGQEIDRIAMRDGILGSDEYLALWEWSGDLERPGTPDEIVDELTAELDAQWRPAAGAKGEDA
jgi:predicted GNAT superfamily acetyltransferase